MTSVSVAALILAGGRGSRLRASVPKPLVRLGKRPLLSHVLGRLPASIDPVVLNANDRAAFAGFDLPVVEDRIAGFQGPLAGLDAGAAWLRAFRPDIDCLLCVPGDTPFLPPDLASRFLAQGGRRPLLASFEGILQPTVALWPHRSLDGLAAYLDGNTGRSLVGYAEKVGFGTVPFEGSDAAPHGDPFFNINTPADLAEAERWLSR